MILSRQSRGISANVTTEAQLLNYFQPFQFKLFFWSRIEKPVGKKSFLFNFFSVSSDEAKKNFTISFSWEGSETVALEVDQRFR